MISSGSTIFDEAGHSPSVSVFGDLIIGQRHPDIIAKFAHGLSSFEAITTATGTTTFIDENAVNSCVEYNVLATGFSGGSQVWFDVASRNNGVRFTLDNKKIQLYPGSSYTLTAQSASAVAVDLSFDWFEEH